MPEREPTLEEMQAKSRLATSDDSLTISGVQWASRTGLPVGLGPGFSDGRVLMTISLISFFLSVDKGLPLVSRQLRFRM